MSYLSFVPSSWSSNILYLPLRVRGGFPPPETAWYMEVPHSLCFQTLRVLAEHSGAHTEAGGNSVSECL